MKNSRPMVAHRHGCRCRCAGARSPAIRRGSSGHIQLIEDVRDAVPRDGKHAGKRVQRLDRVTAGRIAAPGRARIFEHALAQPRRLPSSSAARRRPSASSVRRVLRGRFAEPRREIQREADLRGEHALRFRPVRARRAVPGSSPVASRAGSPRSAGGAAGRWSRARPAVGPGAHAAAPGNPAASPGSRQRRGERGMSRLRRQIQASGTMRGALAGASS